MRATNIIRFVEATDLIPRNWENWFWDELSNSPNVTFGDNNYSLITADRFANEVKDILASVTEDDVFPMEVDSLMAELEELKEGNIYINL